MEYSQQDYDKVYKINECDESVIYNNISLNSPVKIEESYFCKNKKNFFIQINNLKSEKGFYKFNNKIFINFDLKSYGSNNDINNIYDFFESIDNILIKNVSELFEIWFHKKISYKNLIEYYVPIILTKNETDNEYENFFINQVPINDNNELDINIYDENNNLIEQFYKIKNIGKSIGILNFNGIYFQKKKFFCVWELIQMKLIN